ncbi:MAG: CBS domain-containing protein [Hyphomicrobiales bacterium]|jgi:CBS domain-containing protein|nr:CBS domain-containing protein [Hyphomicrobiales bacterium]
MATVRQILDAKGHDVATVGPDTTVYDAIKKMADKNIGSLVVTDGEKIAGIITERHYARNVILKGKASPDTHVKDIMSTRVVCAWPDQSVEECMAVMTDKSVRHLPVLEDKRLVGLVSIGDLVKSIISDQKFTIEQLERYIGG